MLTLHATARALTQIDAMMCVNSRLDSSTSSLFSVTLGALARLSSGNRCCPALLVLGPVPLLLGIELAAGTTPARMCLGLADEAPIFLDGGSPHA